MLKASFALHKSAGEYLFTYTELGEVICAEDLRCQSNLMSRMYMTMVKTRVSKCSILEFYS